MVESQIQGTSDSAYHRRRWLFWSIAGLIFVGAGVSITGEAIIRKGADEAWFLLGTAGLVVLNSGLSFFGQGVIHRVRERVGR